MEKSKDVHFATSLRLLSEFALDSLIFSMSKIQLKKPFQNIKTVELFLDLCICEEKFSVLIFSIFFLRANR